MLKVKLFVCGGLAIIADTYSNHNGPHNHAHPYVSAMVNNGTLHYDHDRWDTGTYSTLPDVRVADPKRPYSFGSEFGAGFCFFL